jgi:SAM-dependent methyltransferase
MSQLLRLYERNKYFRGLLQKLGFEGEGQTEISSERFIEYPWAFKNLEQKNTKILDVGSTGSYFPLALACLGHKVYVIDIRPYEYRSHHPNLKDIIGDIRHTEFPDNFFDAVTAISTIEHIGLGRYGDPLDKEGDKKATQEIRRILKPKGKLLLTVPYGKPAVTKLNRVYDANKLQSILKDFKIEHEDYFFKKSKCWYSVTKEYLANVESSTITKGIACIKAVK